MWQVDWNWFDKKVNLERNKDHLLITSMTMVAMKLLWTVIENEMILNEMILGAQAFQLSIFQSTFYHQLEYRSNTVLLELAFLFCYWYHHGCHGNTVD